MLRVEKTTGAVSLERLNRYLLDEFLEYSSQTKVIFQYRYCDNAENRKRGRAGRVSGFRQAQGGVRHRRYGTVKYFDIGRQAVRSLRETANVSVIISSFWNAATGQWVDLPELAGLNGGTVERQNPSGGSGSRDRERRKSQIERERSRIARRRGN